nr:TonB-dependent receptor [Acinetobacter sp. MD2]
MQQLYAQDETQLNTAQLAVIKVEATHTDTSYLQTPASVFRVDAPKQQNNLGVNLTEVLQGVPSIQLNNRENYAQDLQLSMRGFGARSTFGVRGIRLYVDGIPATMPDGQGQTSNIDLQSLDHLEVLTGPFSTLYGNSSGGVVLASTKEGQGPDSITLRYGGGSDQRSSSSLILQGGAKQDNEPSYVVSSSYFDTNGYRDHSAANKVLNNAKLTWNLTDGSKINWVTNYVKINADDPQGLSKQEYLQNPKQVQANVNLYRVRKEIQQTQTGVTWSKPMNDQNELYAMAYVGNRQVTQYQGIPFVTQKNPNNAGGVIDFDRNYYGLDLRWTGKEFLPNTTISAGLALDRMNEDRKGYLNVDSLNNPTAYGIKGDLRRDENNTLWSVDPYLQASWQFLPTWRIDTGIRYSNVHYQSENHLNANVQTKKSADKVLPSIAMSWQIQPKLLAYMSYSKGFETPTFTETSYSLDTGLGSPQITNGINQSLKPATSDNYEIGLKSQNVYGVFTVAVFNSQTQNDIVSFYSDAGRSVFHNIDKTTRNGVELSWNKKLWRDLTAQASYSFLDAKFASDVQDYNKNVIRSGNKIPGVAQNQAYVGLNWQSEQGLFGGVDVHYMDKVYVNDANSEAAPSYTVTALNIGYSWKLKDWALSTYARVDNLFDKQYVGSTIINVAPVPVNGVQVGRYYEPAEGRNWSAGLSLTKQF